MSLKSILERQDVPSELKKVISNELSEFKRTKARLVYLLKSGPAIIYACEPWGDYRTKFMSENVKDILGYDPEEFLNNPPFWVNGIHPEDKQRITESFSMIIDTHFFSETYRFQQKDGKYRWMLEEANLIRDEEGNPTEIVGYWTDITKQKRAEEQLERERENLYRILNSTDDLICIVDSHYEIQFINAAAKKEFGPLEGKKCYEYFNSFSEACSWCTMEKVISGKTIRREKTLPRNQKTYDMIDTPLRNLDGSVSSLAIFRDITDRRKTEEALKESEENFRELVDLLPTTVFEIDPSGNFLFSNRHGLEISGYTQEDLDQGLNALQLFVPEERPMVKRNILKILGGENLEGHEYTALRKDGSTFPVLIYSAPVYRDKKPVKLRGIVVDITLLKETEKALRESEQKFRSFIETLPAPVWIYQNYQCRYANPAAEQITSYSREELSLMKFWDFLHPDYKNMAIEGGKVLEKGLSPLVTSAIVKIITKSGNERWLDTRLELIEFEGKRATLIFAMDITERKQAEEALRKSEAKYRNLVERANDGIAIVKEDKLVFLNQKIAQMLGYAIEELLNTDYTHIIHPDAISTIIERYQARIANKNVPSIYESKLKKKDGSILDVELNVGLIDYQGDKTATLSFVRDITERKKAEEQLQYQANLLTYVSDAVIASDLDFRITSWNKAAELIYGWQEEEAMGKEVGYFLKQEYPYNRREDVIEDFMREGVWQGEVIQRRKDRTVINILASVTLVKDRTGKPIATLAVNRDITKRKQIEQALKENEERYRSFIENFQGIAFKGYEDYSQEFFLGKVKEITGYSEDDFLSGKIVFKDLIHPEDIQRIANDVVKFYSSSEESHRREYRIIDRYGTVHWLQEDITKFISEKENRKGVYGTIQDITKRKQAEEALRKSEVKYRLLFESAPIGIGISNIEGRVHEANQRILETMDYTSDEIKNVSLSDTYVNPEDRRKLIRILLESGYIKDFEVKLKRKDGTPYHALYNIALMELEDQKVFLTTLRDLTEWREMDKAKRDTEERLRKFMESATDGFTLLDSDLNIIDMNKAGLTGLSLPKEKVIGMNLLDIFPKSQGTKTYNQYLEVLKTGNPYYIDDIASAPRIRQKYYSVRAFKVGEGLGIITTDITDRVRAEKTREELEQRRDSFVWMTSHELRTPLTVLTGYCDFLIEHIDDLAQKRITNILSVMKSNLDRLERLTGKVSTIGQIERGIFEIEKTSMNLCDFLRDTLEPYHQLLGNQFEFKGCLEDLPIIVEGDPNRLQQVIDNIIGNAIKQTDKTHRKIRIISKISPSDIIIEVSDNGAGIEPEDLEVIFEQFVSIPTEFSATGTGIGLYLSRKTLEAHNGRITAQSKGLGHGATFIIELPRKKL